MSAMTSSDLKTFMAKHAFTVAEIAWVAGCSTRQVYHWLSGKYVIPQAASLLLQAYDEGKIDSRWLLRHLPEKS